MSGLLPISPSPSPNQNHSPSTPIQGKPQRWENLSPALGHQTIGQVPTAPTRIPTRDEFHSKALPPQAHLLSTRLSRAPIGAIMAPCYKWGWVPRDTSCAQAHAASKKPSWGQKHKYQGCTAAADRSGIRGCQALDSLVRPSSHAAPFKECWVFQQGSSLNFSLEACHWRLQPAAG